MYTLNFPNGNVQTYETFSQMNKAAELMGGEAKRLSGDVFIFVPKK